jgi:hypothetical protein
VLGAHRQQLDSTAKILIERETLERGEFEALLAGTPEAEVFKDKDEKARQRSQSEDSGQKRAPVPRQPRVGPPLPADTMPS